MAKVSSVQKNLKRRKMSELPSGEAKRKEIKKQLKNKDLSWSERQALQDKLSTMPRDTSSIRVRNRCFVTGRSRGNIRRFGISRIMLRELGSQGLIPGLKKSSW